MLVATMNQGPRVNHKIPLIDEVLPVPLRACYGMDTDLFTGYDGETTADRVFRETDAKQVCSHCRLLEACLGWAQKHDERGVWGGTNDDDRRFLRTGRRPKSHSANDPEGKTKQQRRRSERIKIAKNLRARNITLEDIAKEIGVTLGTVYDYFRYEGKDHEQASAGQDQQAQATSSEGVGSPDPRREEAPILKARS